MPRRVPVRSYKRRYRTNQPTHVIPVPAHTKIVPTQGTRTSTQAIVFKRKLRRDTRTGIFAD